MRIKVTGKQFDMDNNKIDEIQLITDASAKKQNNTFIIDYVEKSENEEENIATRLRATDKKLVMTKLSLISSSMEFEVDKKYYSVYTTVYGNLKMVISTSEYSCNLNDEGIGTIHLKYSVNLGENEPYTNILTIDLYE